MFYGHEIKYIKEREKAKFIRVDGKSGEIVVNAGFLPNFRKRTDDPSNSPADLITLRNRAWRNEKPPHYLHSPKRLDTEKESDRGYWTYWADSSSLYETSPRPAD